WKEDARREMSTGGGKVTIAPRRAQGPWSRNLVASPGVFIKRAGLPRTLIETPSRLVACAQRCAGPPVSEKPYLPHLVPLVAPVREQRFAPAHAGDAT